ncbi:hypothetical protein [Clostridium subterminale]|uniref:Uncharacterized protein n=1 Tax=Clostridium subterminale TaxID=1550 RepID=A0ABN1KPH5_CLOSU
MKQDVKGYMSDVLFCFKLSLKLVIIPVVLGIVISCIYQLIKGQAIELSLILIAIRNIGIVFSCGGLFVSALGFLQPTKLLRPLSYEKTWRQYLDKFGLVGTIFCTSAFLVSYFLIYDILVYNLYV